MACIQRASKVVSLKRGIKSHIHPVRFSETMEEDDDRMLPARREVPCASLPVDDEATCFKRNRSMLKDPTDVFEAVVNKDDNNNDDCDQKLPAARPVVLSTDTVMEIIHLVSQQSNAFELPMIAELEIMLHAMSNMHESSVVQGSDEADNHLVEMIRGKLIVEQFPHSSDRPFGNSRQTTIMALAWAIRGSRVETYMSSKQQSKYKWTILSDGTKSSDTATSPITKMNPG